LVAASLSVTHTAADGVVSVHDKLSASVPAASA
jgi:hypothetical protein